MAAWTPDSELGPVQQTAPRNLPQIHPAHLVMIAVAISIPATLAAGWVLVQLAFHFCWGCGGGL